jgi:hypothetical protein
MLPRRRTRRSLHLSDQDAESLCDTPSLQVKLSASGQEVGGDLLFPRRVGFSGTPSDLLPVELGKCGYEQGSDGLMVQVLTDPRVCDFELVTSEPQWTVESLLRAIADAGGARAEPIRALIDTGALITGLSNLQVI